MLLIGHRNRWPDMQTDALSWSIPSANTIVMDASTTSLCADDNELAFQLSRQIAASIIEPKKEIQSITNLFGLIASCMIRSRAVRSRFALSTLVALTSYISLLIWSQYRVNPDLDRLALQMMARAGYDPRSAMRVVVREGILSQYAFKNDMHPDGDFVRITVSSVAEYIAVFTNTVV